MRKWAAGFFILAAAVLFYIACGQSPTSPGAPGTTAGFGPSSGPFGPSSGPHGPSGGPYGPSGGPFGPSSGPHGPSTPPGTTPPPTPTGTPPSGTPTPSPSPTPYQPITTIQTVSSGLPYQVVVDPNGVQNVTIYVDTARFFADSVFGDPEVVVTANTDAFNNTNPLLILNVSKKARVTVWIPGAPLTANSFIRQTECPLGAPNLGCWSFTGKGINVLDTSNPNFFDVPDTYDQTFNPGQVVLGPRAVDSPPNNASPQMYFVSVAPCGFSTVTCP